MKDTTLGLSHIHVSTKELMHARSFCTCDPYLVSKNTTSQRHTVQNLNYKEEIFILKVHTSSFCTTFLA